PLQRTLYRVELSRNRATAPWGQTSRSALVPRADREVCPHNGTTPWGQTSRSALVPPADRAVCPHNGTIMSKRILSGVQPSGKLHLGNHFGAIKQHIDLQNEGECFFFIADYHALTTIADLQPDPRKRGATIRDYSHQVALDYLALGLDPDRVAFFRQ